MKKFKIKLSDKKKLVLKEQRDYEILAKIYQLEKRKLNKEQRELIKFLKSQLEDDWRKPLMGFVNRLLNNF